MMKKAMLVALAFSLAVPALSGGREWPLEQEDNIFLAGEPEESFEYFSAHMVDDPATEMYLQFNWSVAACVQMVLNEQDTYREQSDILYRIYGKTPDKRKAISKVRTRLDGWKTEKGVRVKARDHKVTESNIAADLIKYGPLLVGVEDADIKREGHPLVLLQVIFEYDYHKNRVPKKVVLLDPWPVVGEKRQEMTWYDFINHLEWSLRLETTRR